MPFNINSFKTNINSFGYLPSNKFEVYLRPPDILLNNAINIAGTDTEVADIVELLKFRVESIKAPGITLISADVAKYGIGPTQKMPFNAQMGEITLSILSDGYGDLWRFWHNWIRGIFEFNGLDSAQGNQANKLPSYTVEYKNNFSTVMQLIIYDMFGNAINKINMYEVFPTAMKDIELNWSETNSLLRLEINLSFTEFTIIGNSIKNDEYFTNQRLSNSRTFDGEAITS